MITGVAWFLASVVMAASGHVFIKKGATRTHSFIGSFFDPFVIAGYVFMLASTVAATISLKTMPLKVTVSLQPLGFILIVLLSVVFLHERMRRHHLWGMLLILAGIVIFSVGR
jgi:multidrug transporter EmrE-like cation transporter